jgi:hypothetical protein
MKTIGRVQIDPMLFLWMHHTAQISAEKKFHLLSKIPIGQYISTYDAFTYLDTVKY